MIRGAFIIYFICSTLFTACKSKTEVRNVFYDNDFEVNNFTGLNHQKTTSFNQTLVLGNFNNQEVSLMLNNLPSHDLVEVSFDLYIHDTWDGNKLSGGIDGPDIWKMLIDNKLYINTTFSNTPCFSVFCPPQSYPDNYLNNNNNPKDGAFNKDLPGLCSLAGTNGGSALYQIKKIVPHISSGITLILKDELLQPNVNEPLCDESWSIDNLKITLISLN